MHVLLLSLLIGFVVAVPQGYNYQNQIVTSSASNNDFTVEQLQVLQEILQQQQLQLQDHQLQLQQLQQHHQYLSANQIVDNNIAETELGQSIPIRKETIAANDGYRYDSNDQLVQPQLQQQQQQHQESYQQQQPQQQTAFLTHEETQQQTAQVSDIPAPQAVQAQQLQLSEVQQLPHIQNPHHSQPNAQSSHQFQTQLESQILPQIQPSSLGAPELQTPLIKQQNAPGEDVHLQQQQETAQSTPTHNQQQLLTPPSQYSESREVVQQQQQQQQEQHQSPAVEYSKEFYYLSAPQEDSDVPTGLQEQLNSVKKNLRVLFIRAPEQNGLTKAALQLAQQSHDTQTAIYVLSKQHDVGELANKLQQIRQTTHSKPEVIFVKYKTPEEAAHAQRTIQAEYEALQGPNYFNHDSVSTTQNFISSASAASEPQRSIPSREYLPPPTSAAKA